MQIGDRVRVVEDVWDDNREKSWRGYEGIIQSTEKRWVGNKKWGHFDPYNIFVFFPKSRGKWRYFDFKEEELEVIND